jgi:hypothetical protein
MSSLEADGVDQDGAKSRGCRLIGYFTSPARDNLACILCRYS